MTCEVEYTDNFEDWWHELSDDEQVSVAASVELLATRGTALPHPYSSGVESSKHSHMRELRIQHCGDPYRVLYAFDPRRIAILLIGGNKRGNNRWYEEYIPVADRIYDNHLIELEREQKCKDD